MRLSDKVAVITGAGRGIGQACARRLASEGARVIVADIDRDGGEAAATALRAAGHNARYVACDVADRAQAAALVRATVKAYGRLDILVNNAGVIHTGDFLEVAEADFDRVLRVNLKGAFLTGQAAARRMVEQGGGGAIVNLSSVGALVAIPDQTAYNVSKGGVAQLTRVMALSLAPHGIRVNAVAPGTVATEMIKALIRDQATRRSVLSRIPMGRLCEPSEIAAVAAFLASDESSYMTGQTIYCDGGRLALNHTVSSPDEEGDRGTG